jgi:hypothetical protein
VAVGAGRYGLCQGDLGRGSWNSHSHTQGENDKEQMRRKLTRPDGLGEWGNGTFVPQFDDGPIAVGNGASSAHWVRDVLKVRAVAIGPDPAGKTIVMVTAEVYMFLRWA